MNKTRIFVKVWKIFGIFNFFKNVTKHPFKLIQVLRLDLRFSHFWSKEQKFIKFYNSKTILLNYCQFGLKILLTVTMPFAHDSDCFCRPNRSREYRVGPLMIAIIFMVGTNYDCNPHNKKGQIWLQCLLWLGLNMIAIFITNKSQYDCNVNSQSDHIWLQSFSKKTKYARKKLNRKKDQIYQKKKWFQYFSKKTKYTRGNLIRQKGLQ